MLLDITNPPEYFEFRVHSGDIKNDYKMHLSKDLEWIDYGFLDIGYKCYCINDSVDTADHCPWKIEYAIENINDGTWELLYVKNNIIDAYDKAMSII